MDRPPEQDSAIGKVMVGSDGKPVINATAVIGAIREQLKIETQYRAMLSVDLAARPGPVLDEDARIKIAEIRGAQMEHAAQARPVPLAALPSNYRHLSPAKRAEADMNRRRAAYATQQAAIDAAPPEVVQGEIIDD